MWFRCLALGLVALLSSGARANGADLVASRGELHLRLGDGRVLRGAAVAGETLLIGQGGSTRSVRVDRVDVSNRGGSPLLLYTLSVEGSSPSERRFLCRPDLDGRRAAIPITAKDGAIRFTCTSGAEGKCALLGYVPWGGEASHPMLALHQACVHLMRADYGGDGQPATQEGTLIHVYDRFGFRPFRQGTGMLFEAAWSVNGAVCVAHTRNARLADLATLAKRYSHLAGQVGPRRCNEALMRRRSDALLFNLSKPAQDTPSLPEALRSTRGQSRR
jgi:ADYC domain